MSIIERGIAIGFAAAAGVGAFAVGLAIIATIIAIIAVFFIGVGCAREDVDDE